MGSDISKLCNCNNEKEEQSKYESGICDKTTPSKYKKLNKQSTISDIMSERTNASQIKPTAHFLEENCELYYTDGTTYTGKVNPDKQKHGPGRITYSDGSFYEGAFLNDEYEGNGKLMQANLTTYEGEFHKGFKHGYGKQYNADKTRVYEGQWDYGKKHGQGKINLILVRS